MNRVTALIKRYVREIASVRDYLFAFLTLWTIAILVMAWLDFASPRLSLSDVAANSYLILLSVYIVHKEVNRWTGTKLTVKPGELVVYIWWTSLLAMIVIGFLTQASVPEGVKSISFNILGALLATEISKSLNSYKTKGKISSK
ncbi:MAG: hypothetical protein WD898_03815 [Candidatus Paceibacterota bacterium]